MDGFLSLNPFSALTLLVVYTKISSLGKKNFKFTVFFLFGDSSPLTPYRTECVYLCIAVKYHDITWVGN